MIRSKLVYLFLLVILVLFFILYRGLLSLQLLVFGLIFPVLLRILLSIQLHGINIRLVKPEHPVGKGESFEWFVRITCTSPVPAAQAVLTLEYASSMTERPQQLTLELPVMGGQTQQLHLRYRSVTSGTMTMRVKSLAVYDVFRLFRAKKRLDQEQVLYVLPAVPKFEDWEPEVSVSDDNAEFSKLKPGDDPSEIFDLHQYHEGDLISRVHWKLSSKLDELMVKEYSLPVAKQYRLIPDQRFAGEGMEAVLRLDAAGSLLRTVSQKLLDAQLPVMVCSMPAGHPEALEFPANSEPDVLNAICALLSAGTAEETDLHAAAYLAALQTDEHCPDSLLFFTPRLEEAAADLLTSLPHPELLTVFAVRYDEEMQEELPFRVVGVSMDELLPPWEMQYLSGDVSFPEGGVSLQ